MFNILVSADGLAWENDQIMKMQTERFKEYSGVESEAISLNRPETLASLEAVETILMYETGVTGPHTDVVRVGKISDIRAGSREIIFHFKETGRLPYGVVEQYANLLGIGSFEFNRTHWAIKDGTIHKLVREKIEMVKERFDIALSFAGEDRQYVEKVAAYLASKNIAVFYDKFEEVDLWGKDLAEHLDWVYRSGAQYCVMFISKHYAEKMWANHERKSALAAAIQARKEYILPARFDSTELPGLRPTVGYINLTGRSPEELGQLIVKKLGR